MSSERQKYLSKEKIKMEKCGTFTMTREEEIKALKSLIRCMKMTENFTEEEYEEIYQTELQKINEKYNSNTTL